MRNVFKSILVAALIPGIAYAQAGGTPSTAQNQTAVQAAAGASSAKAVGIQGVAGGIPIPISGTITSSAAAFAPTGKVTLSAGTTSAPVALASAGPTALVINSGTVPAYVNFGGSNVVATLNSYLVPAGWAIGFNIGSNTYMAAIVASGTGALDITTGTGIPALTGGGGGGGAGGSVTITGTLPAYAATPTFNCGTGCYAVTQPISAASLPLPTGAATAALQPALNGDGGSLAHVTNFPATQPVSGTVTANVAGGNATAVKVDGSSVTQPVSISASVPVTGTFFQATQPVSATSLPLPAGAATAAKQPALGTAGAASTDVLTIQGIAGGVAQSVSNTGAFAVQNTAALPTGSNTIGAISNATFAATQATASALNATVVGTGTLAVQNTAAVVGGNGVAVKTDGSATTQPISATALPLPALAATSTLQTSGGQKTQIVDGAGNVIASTSNNLNVQCANCSGSGVSTADNATFTAGSSLFVSSGGIYQSAATSNPLTAGRQGLGQFTQYRAAHVNLRDSSGNELGLVGTPLYVICSSGCSGGGGSGYSVLNASTYANTASYSNVPSGGLVATSAPTYTTGQASPISLTTAGAIRIDGTATTQPISGTVAATQSGTWTDTVTQATAANLNATVVGTGTFATQAAQSGTWTVQPGNTQNTTAWLTQDASNAAISAGAAPAKASIVGGVFNTTLPTLTTGQTAGLQVDSSGRAIVAQATASALNATVVQATAANLQTTATLAAAANKIGITGVAQASTITSQYGDMVQGSVTTAAPTYTTATINPLSLNTAGGLRVDGSGVTQPVSAAALPLPTGAATLAAQTAVTGSASGGTAAASSQLAGGVYTSTPPTLTTGQQVALQTDVNGLLKVNCTGCSASSNVTANAGTQNAYTLLSNASATGTAYTVNGGSYLLSAPAFTGSGSVAIVGTLGGVSTTYATYTAASPVGQCVAVGQGTTVQAVVTGTVSGVYAFLNGTNCTAALTPTVATNSTGGVSIVQGDTSVPINVSTATTTQLVALSTGKKIYVTAMNMMAAGATNVTLEYGTGTACGTGTTVLTGAYPLTAQAGLSYGSGLGPVLIVPAGNALCAVNSAAIQVSGSLMEAQF